MKRTVIAILAAAVLAMPAPASGLDLRDLTPQQKQQLRNLSGTQVELIKVLMEDCFNKGADWALSELLMAATHQGQLDLSRSAEYARELVQKRRQCADLNYEIIRKLK